MEDSSNIVRRGIFTLAILLLLVSSLAIYDTASGQSQDNPPESYKRYAQLEAISDRRLTFQLKFEDGQVASVTQYEGALIRVESTKDKTILGLSPIITKDGNVHIKVFKVESILHQDSLIGETLSEKETLTLNEYETRIADGVFSFGIKLAGDSLRESSEKKTL